MNCSPFVENSKGSNKISSIFFFNCNFFNVWNHNILTTFKEQSQKSKMKRKFVYNSKLNAIIFFIQLTYNSKKKKNSLRFNHKVERKNCCYFGEKCNVIVKKWSKRRNQFIECPLKINSFVYIQNCTKSLKRMVFVKREKKLIFTPFKNKSQNNVQLKMGFKKKVQNIIMLISIRKMFFFLLKNDSH